MIKTNHKKYVVGVYFALACIVGLFFGGEMVRGEVSPWFWGQFVAELNRNGFALALLEALPYLLVYSLAFSLPYFLLLAIFSVRLDRVGNTSVNRADLKLHIALVSMACLLTFLFLLESIIAFVRRIPSDIWNGWLLISWAGVSFILLFAGFSGLKRDEDKIYVKVRNNAEIWCCCPRCGCEWRFPAEDLRTRGIVF